MFEEMCRDLHEHRWTPMAVTRPREYCQSSVSSDDHACADDTPAAAVHTHKKNRALPFCWALSAVYTFSPCSLSKEEGAGEGDKDRERGESSIAMKWYWSPAQKDEMANHFDSTQSPTLVQLSHAKHSSPRAKMARHAEAVADL